MTGPELKLLRTEMLSLCGRLFKRTMPSIVIGHEIDMLATTIIISEKKGDGFLRYRRCAGDVIHLVKFKEKASVYFQHILIWYDNILKQMQDFPAILFTLDHLGKFFKAIGESELSKEDIYTFKCSVYTTEMHIELIDNKNSVVIDHKLEGILLDVHRVERLSYVVNNMATALTVASDLSSIQIGEEVPWEAYLEYLSVEVPRNFKVTERVDYADGWEIKLNDSVRIRKICFDASKFINKSKLIFVDVETSLGNINLPVREGLSFPSVYSYAKQFEESSVAMFLVSQNGILWEYGALYQDPASMVFTYLPGFPFFIKPKERLHVDKV